MMSNYIIVETDNEDNEPQTWGVWHFQSNFLDSDKYKIAGKNSWQSAIEIARREAKLRKIKQVRVYLY